MTTPAQPAPVCCGEGRTACPDKPGQPQTLACQLCPRSGDGVYWRTRDKAPAR